MGNSIEKRETKLRHTLMHIGPKVYWKPEQPIVISMLNHQKGSTMSQTN